ncbi:unnamed protein product [Rotaria sordida]|uniref:protein-serine/threonine phosphatase n=2 Tax=Rotaria sordida TaxID=392033 RepID=A0A813UBG4_9BILA|nr:unnamed protein product [Rotaria sordida]CAF0823552.1 unnamed protein product [Rotaria sordida]CAF3873976.1 unnamed protein product [Rotaria sordida]
MGAYLSSPICDKNTIEGSNNHLSFAASSMQGWRMSQEDAHNAILNFDDNTSLFAVYDGHGGSEIAVYCSQNLPEFIKKLDSYQNGQLNDALIESFLKFDTLLLDLNVKKILQKLANDDEHDDTEQSHEFVASLNPNEENHHNDELNIEEAQLLKKEAEVPIEEILKRYSGNEKHFHSPNISKHIIDNHEENIQISPINQDSNLITNSNEENTTDITTEIKPSSSEEKISSRNLKKPTTTDSPTIIKSNSLTRHLLSDNTDELDDDDDDDDDDEDDFEFNGSDEETSGDEAEDHEIDENEEEDDNDDDDKPLEASKAAQIQKLMRKSIMAILNRRAKKKKRNTVAANDDDEDVKENHNEDHESDDNEEEEGEDDDDDDDEEDIDDEDDTDLAMLDMDNDPGSSSGCTAVVTLLRDKQLYVANAGDSRCVVCRNGQAIEMSFDHKPEDPKERSRIEKAGYKVTLDGRVSGGLNLSRAIGDHAYKKKSLLSAEEQAITALPDIRTLTLDDQDEFMIIACDGIWNFMSSQDVIEFVRLRLDKKTLSQICEELFMYCLAPNTCGDGTGCDNMTAIIVKFNFNSQSTTLQSSISLNNNNKRSLSPEHPPTTDITDNSNNKKLKILTENCTNETKSTDIFSLNSTEQTLS